MATARDPYSNYKYNRNEGSRNEEDYPNPFFDMANNFIPKNIKTLFKYCNTFFHTDPFLSNVVRKLTEYPITDILYETDIDTETRKKYDKLLHEKLNIKNTLIEIGLDYYTYGNSFISIFMLSKRFLKLPGPEGELVPIEKADYKFRDYKFYMKREGWAGEKRVEVVDNPIKSIEGLRLTRWNPQNIEISYNPVTGDREYYYDPPSNIKNRIKKGDKSILKDIPMIFLKSLKKQKKIKLDKSNFYHFKRPGLAEQDMGWGKPIILPAIKKIYYLQTLQRGNEAIANEHIVPKKSISPANTATLDPLTQMNLGKWKGQIEEQISKWRQDPNHMAVFPIPIGYQELGGNSKGLLLTKEMNFLEEVIINSLGVPLEFVKGGVSWTGSSISLRIMENMFMTYRNMLLDFLNHFLLEVLHRHLKYPKVKIRFKNLKMTDDAQSKQLLLQLSEMGKISDQKLADEFGHNWQEIKKDNKENAKDNADLQKQNMKEQAEAKGESQVIAQKYQIRAKFEAQKEFMKLRINQFQDELQEEYGSVPPSFLNAIDKVAMQIMFLNPAQQATELSKLSKTKPATHALVMERIQMYQELGVVPGMENPKNEKAGNPNAKENPPNKNAPAEREENKVDVPEEEKTKGQTRGSL